MGCATLDAGKGRQQKNHTIMEPTIWEDIVNVFFIWPGVIIAAFFLLVLWSDDDEDKHSPGGFFS